MKRLKKKCAVGAGQPDLKIMRSPRSVDIDITARCNLRCRYCYFFANSAVNYHDLRTGEWLDFFDELGECSVMHVSLAGGEPFMRDDFPALIDGIIRNRMRFSVLSNGGLIDDERAAFIAGSGRCDFVQVSVDGSEAEVHDVFRGRGAFAGAISGIRTLQNHGVPVTVRVTVHRHNVHDLELIARFLLEKLGLAGFSTNAAHYMGLCRQNPGDIQLTSEDREAAMETLLRLSDKYVGRITAMAGPLAEALHWHRMEEAHMKGASPFPKGGHLTGCGCLFDKIAVRTDGVIVPCSMLPHIELGRVTRDSFIDVWQKSPDLNMLRLRNSIPLTDFAFCSGCEYIPYCTGNCPGLAYNLTGEVNHPSPDACLRDFKESVKRKT